MSREEALDFFAEFYYGKHHVPELKETGDGGWYVNHHLNQISTYDFHEMTRLVFMAHEKCVRVAVTPRRWRRQLQIIIHKRDRTKNGISSGHPTIEEALERFNMDRADKRNFQF